MFAEGVRLFSLSTVYTSFLSFRLLTATFLCILTLCNSGTAYREHLATSAVDNKLVTIINVSRNC